MNSAPMVLRLASGSVMPASAARKRSLASTCTSGMLKWSRNSVTTCLASFVPQQAVVDEDAGELVADRLVDQHGGHRAVDAAGQPADHAALADLGADLGDLARAEMRHGPVARQAGDAVHEVADQLAARAACAPPRGGTARRRAALLVGDGRERRALGHADHLEARRQPRDAVAVAHPHGVVLALLPHALEQRAVAGDLELGAAELAVVAALDAAAQLRHMVCSP